MDIILAILLYCLTGVLFLGQYARRYPHDPVNIGLVVVVWPAYVIVAAALPLIGLLSRWLAPYAQRMREGR